MARLLLLALLVLPACRNKDDTSLTDTGTVDTGEPVIDADLDGSPADEDCDDGNGAVYPGNEETPYNGLDDDCDSSTPDDDLDGDGYGVNDDCDDANADVHPGATEICNDVDDDCSGDPDDGVGDLWYADEDADGYGDPDVSVQDCDGNTGYVADATDCDDLDPQVFPGADEVCNDQDDDCDALVDDDDPDLVDAPVWSLDFDGDGYGGADVQVAACEAPEGYVADATDCDDAHAEASPDGTEVCDGLDNDCDGATDDADDDVADPETWWSDADGDGYGDPDATVAACEQPSTAVDNSEDCDDTDATVSPDTVWYLDADGDGHGTSDVTTTACEQPARYTDTATDCDDLDASSFPGGIEVCDGADNDCDTAFDEGASDASTWYADTDADGYGDASSTTDACDAPSGHVADSSDCDDGDGAVNPSAAEICDGDDEDCDGLVDDDDPDLTDAGTWYDDADGDGYGDAGSPASACDQPSNTVADATDCDDTDAALNPDTSWYLDHDGDGYGDPSLGTTSCEQPSALYVLDDQDCDDGDSSVHPGAALLCDGGDGDCDGAVDNDLDGDGFPDSACGGSDCDDTDASIFPDPSGPCAEGTSCQDLLDRGYATADGSYWIDTDGYATGEDPEEVWCDLTLYGGGWTLLGASGQGGDQWGHDEIDDPDGYGSLSLTSGYKAQLYSGLAFTDLYFTDGTLHAVYEGVSDGSMSLYDFQASVPADNCGSSDGYRWSMTDGDLAGGSLCDTDLYMHPMDEDGTYNAACDPDQVYGNHGFGPTWSTGNNDGCPLDDPSSTGFAAWDSRPGWDTSAVLLMYAR